jgi:hypothetical protein
MSREPKNFEQTCRMPDFCDREPDVTPADFFFRIGALIALAILCVILAVSQTGCTYTRNAPLFQTSIEANGNTVPVSAVP